MARARDIARKLAAALDADIARQVGLLAATVTAELRRANPKDTGWSSVNWMPKIGRPSTVGGPAFDEAHANRDLRLSLVTFESAAQSGAIAYLANYRLRDGNIYITNYVRYVRRLDAGWSGQAPAGWVRMAIEAGIDTTRVPSLGVTIIRT